MHCQPGDHTPLRRAAITVGAVARQATRMRGALRDEAAASPPTLQLSCATPAHHDFDVPKPPTAHFLMIITGAEEIARSSMLATKMLWLILSGSVKLQVKNIAWRANQNGNMWRELAHSAFTGGVIALKTAVVAPIADAAAIQNFQAFLAVKLLL